MNWYKMIMDNLMMIAFISVMLFVAVGLFVNAGKSCDTKVNFIVVGNYTELNGTMPELQFECVKLCGERFHNAQTRLELCYEQCVKAGSLAVPSCGDAPLSGCRGFVNETK